MSSSAQQYQAQITLLQTQIYEKERAAKEQIKLLNDQIEALSEEKYQRENDYEQLQADLAQSEAQRAQFEQRVKQLEGIKFDAMKKADQAEAQKMALKGDMDRMKEYYEREKERLVDERCKGLLKERAELQKRIQILEDVVNRQDVETQLQNQEKETEIQELRETVARQQEETKRLAETVSSSAGYQPDAQAYQQSVNSIADQIKQQQDAARRAQQMQQEAFKRQQEQLAAFKQKQLEQQLQMQQQLISAAAPAPEAPQQFQAFDGLQSVSAKMNSAEAVKALQALQQKADLLQEAVQENDKAFIRLQKQITVAIKLAEACEREKTADAFVPSAQLEEMNRQQNQLRGEIQQLRVLQQKDKKRADAAEAMVSELEQQIGALEQELLFFSAGNGGAANRREARHQALYDAMNGTKTVNLISGARK